ncbi:phosphatidate cytidylyltransferase [Paenibacillus sp. ACRRX]|uniref:phosphatidate cytidylyltransferase n=1 Tax=unclassified Paenibacillus TaxID=185978 RepID=UPI001EF5A493|nr:MULTISPECIES: phosphatidate cytidylyltransferase [unclassified Paenibacillus]MCG7407459.1 phosphatidate cytidylyltransferase [Paenibacillus sp. ACRRX]MDK8180695.1 phosphatidate cytidylyltransferase [Paenibacillus sp. UMB4589-SE434]
MKQRIITGVIGGAIFAGFVYIGSIPYELLLIALALIGYFEFARMHHEKAFDLASIVGYALVLILAVPWAKWGVSFHVSMESTMWLVMFAFLCVTVVTKNRVPIQTASQLWLGAFYIGIGFKYMILTRTMLDEGLFWTILMFAAIWASDIGAYFTGRAIGRHKLWPAISPNKTIEGAVGGIISAMVVCVLALFVRPDVLGVPQALGIGIAASIVGQMGDLIQSAYKRIRGVKDSGTLLPGHGGVLDRCDSWLIVFPFIHLIGLITL